MRFDNAIMIPYGLFTIRKTENGWMADSPDGEVAADTLQELMRAIDEALKQEV